MTIFPYLDFFIFLFYITTRKPVPRPFGSAIHRHPFPILNLNFMLYYNERDSASNHMPTFYPEVVFKLNFSSTWITQFTTWAMLVYIEKQMFTFSVKSVESQVEWFHGNGWLSLRSADWWFMWETKMLSHKSSTIRECLSSGIHRGIRWNARAFMGLQPQAWMVKLLLLRTALTNAPAWSWSIHEVTNYFWEWFCGIVLS